MAGRRPQSSDIPARLQRERMKPREGERRMANPVYVQAVQAVGCHRFHAVFKERRPFIRRTHCLRKVLAAAPAADGQDDFGTLFTLLGARDHALENGGCPVIQVYPKSRVRRREGCRTMRDEKRRDDKTCLPKNMMSYLE